MQQIIKQAIKKALADCQAISTGYDNTTYLLEQVTASETVSEQNFLVHVLNELSNILFNSDTYSTLITQLQSITHGNLRNDIQHLIAAVKSGTANNLEQFADIFEAHVDAAQRLEMNSLKANTLYLTILTIRDLVIALNNSSAVWFQDAIQDFASLMQSLEKSVKDGAVYAIHYLAGLFLCYSEQPGLAVVRVKA